MTAPAAFADVGDVVRRFDEHDQLLDEGTAAAIYLATTLGRPLLLEGEPGVGKTAAAKTLALVLDSPLIRLQCYEGLTASEALYDWNYQRQLLAIRLAEARGTGIEESDLYTETYLIDRPILQCVRYRGLRPPVLLIDEIDRADEHFEAFLLELLAERAITVPEIGTISAAVPPIAVLTSNRTRDLHDALKRRCLYHWIDHPKLDQVVAIVRERVPGATEALAVQVSAAAGRLRTLDLQKSPGTAEVIDWVQALNVLGLSVLDPSTAATTLGSVLKYREDRDVAVGAGLAWVVGE